MSYLLCEDCGISFRNYGKPEKDQKAGAQCPDCGSLNTHVEEDDEE